MSNPTPQENSLEMTDAPDLNTSVDGLALFTDISSGDIKDYQPVLYQINALTDMCDTLLSTKASGLVAAEEDLDLEALQAFRDLAADVGQALNSALFYGTNSAQTSVQRDQSALVSAAIDGIHVYEKYSSAVDCLDGLAEIIETQRSTADIETQHSESIGRLTQDDICMLHCKEILHVTLQRAEIVLYNPAEDAEKSTVTNAAVTQVERMAASLGMDSRTLTDSLHRRALISTTQSSKRRGVLGKTSFKRK